MANIEMRLVSKALRERDLKPALDKGVSVDWFRDEDARDVWRVCVEHWQRYGEVPTPVAVKQALPEVNLLRVEDSYEYCLDQLIEWRRRGITIELLRQSAQKIESNDDHEAALQVLQTGLLGLADVGQSASADIDLTVGTEARVDDYVSLRDLPGGMRGLPSGFPTIDRATGGFQPQQLITLIATANVGKSAITMAIAKHVHMQNKHVMLISFEMSNDEQAARHDAMRAGVAHARLLRGEVSERDVQLLRRHLSRMEGMAPFQLIADPVGASTVSGIAAKLETHKPEMLFIDGVYLMQDEQSGEQNTPRSLTNITRNLKRLAQRFNIPILASTQALEWKVDKKKGISMGSTGYSSSFAQDSDVMLGLQYADEDEEPDERILKVIKSRNGPRCEATLMFDWDNSRFEEVADV